MKRLVFLVSEDWYFCSHRMPLALAAKAAGYAVTVVTRVSEHGERMRNAGLNVVDFSMSRSGTNPLQELRTVMRLRRLYGQLQPDIVHHVALKPVVLGSIAAWMAKVPRIVNAVAGLGYSFNGEDLNVRVLRPVLRALLRWLLGRPGTSVIVQTPYDAQALREIGLPDRQLVLMRGAGVDLREVAMQPESTGAPVVMLAARMLWDKGVGDFVQAARLLRARGVDARFVLVGRRDAGNPRAISLEQLEQWQAEGSVEWWGHCNDMAATLAQCHVFCLPSFHEGIPKVLLEACAAGRPIVASDIAGCREVVRPGVNGVLVPVQQPQQLADALESLIIDPTSRKRLGGAGRRIAEEQFSMDAVIAMTLALYERVSPYTGMGARA